MAADLIPVWPGIFDRVNTAFRPVPEAPARGHREPAAWTLPPSRLRSEGRSTCAAIAARDHPPSTPPPSADRRDRFETLLDIYDLATGPLPEVGEAARLVGSPELAMLKSRLEADWLTELDAQPLPVDLSDDPVEAMRLLATRNRLPSVYRWLANEASQADVLEFLAVEGGPDSGFDDLVSACQVGLFGQAKMEMAQNYWDEMGNGSLPDVHTTLHTRMAEAIGCAASRATSSPSRGWNARRSAGCWRPTAGCSRRWSAPSG